MSGNDRQDLSAMKHIFHHHIVDAAGLAKRGGSQITSKDLM